MVDLSHDEETSINWSDPIETLEDLQNELLVCIRKHNELDSRDGDEPLRPYHGPFIRPWTVDDELQCVQSSMKRYKQQIKEIQAAVDDGLTVIGLEIGYYSGIEEQVKELAEQGLIRII